MAVFFAGVSTQDRMRYEPGSQQVRKLKTDDERRCKVRRDRTGFPAAPSFSLLRSPPLPERVTEGGRFHS